MLGLNDAERRASTLPKEINMYKKLILFCLLGCSVGGGGDQKIQTDKELPELPAYTWLFCFWGDKLLRSLNETFSASVAEITAFLISYHPSDRNHEEWVWAAGGSAAHGSPEHEEVSPTHSRSLFWYLNPGPAWLYGQLIHTQLQSVMQTTAASNTLRVVVVYPHLPQRRVSEELWYCSTGYIFKIS